MVTGGDMGNRNRIISILELLNIVDGDNYDNYDKVFARGAVLSKSASATKIITVVKSTLNRLDIFNTSYEIDRNPEFIYREYLLYRDEEFYAVIELLKDFGKNTEARDYSFWFDRPAIIF